MGNLDINCLIKTGIWVISCLIFLIFVIKDIVNPWLQSFIEQKRKELEFNQKKELDTIYFERSQNIENLQKEIEKRDIKIAELTNRLNKKSGISQFFNSIIKLF